MFQGGGEGKEKGNPCFGYFMIFSHQRLLCRWTYSAQPTLQHFLSCLFLRMPERKQNHLHYLEAKGLQKFSLQYSVRVCKCTCNSLLMSFSKGALITSAQVTNISDSNDEGCFQLHGFLTCRNRNGISPTSVFLIQSVPLFSSDLNWSHKHDVLYPDAQFSF